MGTVEAIESCAANGAGQSWSVFYLTFAPQGRAFRAIVRGCRAPMAVVPFRPRLPTENGNRRHK